MKTKMNWLVSHLTNHLTGWKTRMSDAEYWTTQKALKQVEQNIMRQLKLAEDRNKIIDGMSMQHYKDTSYVNGINICRFELDRVKNEVAQEYYQNPKMSVQ